MRGGGIRARILAAFVLLALGLGLAMGLAGYYAHERMAVHLLAWHSRPVMNALIEAEQRAWRAQEHGRKHLYYGADLADAMHLRFLVGKEIPPAWKSLSPGLHFFDHDRFFVLLEEREGLTYALSGSSGLLQGLRDRLAAVGLCARRYCCGWYSGTCLFPQAHSRAFASDHGRTGKRRAEQCPSATGSAASAR